MSSFLIADDSAHKRDFLKLVLKHAKWDGKILEATTTEAAKEIIEKHPEITAAFIDYEMPTEKGPAVIRFLKEKIPSAHIALVTSYDSKKYHDEAIAAGAEAAICSSGAEDSVIKQLMEFVESTKS